MIAVSVITFLFLDCRQRGHHAKIRSRLGHVFGSLQNVQMFNFHNAKELRVSQVFRQMGRLFVGPAVDFWL